MGNKVVAGRANCLISFLMFNLKGFIRKRFCIFNWPSESSGCPSSILVKAIYASSCLLLSPTSWLNTFV